MNKNWLMLTGVTLLALLQVISPTLAHAAPSVLPPRPTPPVMPEPQPVVGGLIVLRVSSARPELWTVVQWQDGQGAWHNVDGWQGTFDEVVYDSKTASSTGYKTWWVNRADLGKGPFRWVIYQERNGSLLNASDVFFLPGGDGQRTTVETAVLK